MEELNELFGAHVKKSIEIYATEGELLERPLLRLKTSCGRLLHVRLQTQTQKKVTI